jgi:acid phosphatase type 7
MRRSHVVAAAALVLVAVALGSWRLLGSDDDSAGAAPADSPVVVAVGDIACSASMTVSPTTCQHQAVADLAARQGPTAVLALGDTQYPEGDLEDFVAVFDQSFGPLKALIRPVIGNHEYNDDAGGGSGYFDYFNGVGVEEGRAGSRSAPYYSFDVGDWHLIALDSECDDVPGGCGPDSPQRAWLLEDLAAHPATCTLAYWHSPRFTTGSKHQGSRDVGVLWNDLVNAGVEMVLAAHNHNVEIMAPIGVTPPESLVPVADEQGAQQFIIGTGGAYLDPFVGEPLTDASGSVITKARSDGTFGVLRLVLEPGSYEWSMLGIDDTSFRNADGSTTGAFSGRRACH